VKGFRRKVAIGARDMWENHSYLQVAHFVSGSRKCPHATGDFSIHTPL
jgi:hypothetical protein